MIATIDEIYHPFMERFAGFLSNFYSLFPWSVPRKFNFRMRGTCPFFLLEYGEHGAMRFAHHSRKDSPELVLQSADGLQVFQGATSLPQLPGGWELVSQFRAEYSVPWEHRMSFFGVDEFDKIFRETYRKGHNVSVTYARVNEQ